MSFEDGVEKGVGPIFACQLSVKMFMEDITNCFEQRIYAENIYKWLGSIDCTIDELCEFSHDKSEFIFRALTKYKITEPNILMNYGDAIDSLKYQLELIKVCSLKLSA